MAVDARPFPFAQDVRQAGDPLLVLHHTGGGPHRLPGTAHQRKGDGLFVGKHPVHRRVQYRDGQAVQHGGDGHDDVVPGEGLLRGQAATGGEQLVADVLEHFHAGRLVGEAGTLDSSSELDRRVTRPGQLVPPAAHQVLDPLVRLAVAAWRERQRSVPDRRRPARRPRRSGPTGWRAPPTLLLGCRRWPNLPGAPKGRGQPRCRSPAPPPWPLPPCGRRRWRRGGGHGAARCPSPSSRLFRRPCARDWRSERWSWSWGSPLRVVVAWRDTAQVSPSVGVRTWARPRRPPWSLTASSR